MPDRVEQKFAFGPLNTILAIAEASLKNEFWEEKSGEEFMIEAWCENVMLRSLLRENAAGEHDNAIKQIYRRFESRNSTLFTE